MWFLPYAFVCVLRTPYRRTTLQSQLSQFDDEDRETDRASVHAMIPGQVSGACGYFLSAFPLSTVNLLLTVLIINISIDAF